MNERKTKKWHARLLAVCLTVAMAVGLFAGCGKKDNSTGGEKEGGGSAEGHVDISIFLMKDDYELYTSYNDNPIVQYLNDKFDVTLDYQQPAQGSESDQFNLMISTGDYTDVMEISYSSTQMGKLYNQRVIQDLSPYLEEYMPNFLEFLERHPEYKEVYYTEDGKLFTIPMGVREEPYVDMWGGLVYRRDILEKMTDGNVKFPSGEDEPYSIADWDYMLDLMYQYFQTVDLVETAPLILPSSGYFQIGELTSSFGTYYSFFVKDGKVSFGPTEKGYYEYLKKMNEWYEKGYIYQDFASRTGDSFYTPNPSMVNSGGAGIWYGTTAQLADGLETSSGVEGADVRALKPPVNEKDPDSFLGINMLYAATDTMDSNGFVVSTECSEEKLIKWLQICDYLFSEEGAMLRTYGLDEEHGSAECEYNQKLGMEEGYYVWDEDGNYVENPVWSGKTDHSYYNIFTGFRLPGARWNKWEMEQLNPISVEAQEIWGTYGFENTVPTSVNSLLTEDEYTQLKDYAAYYSTELDVWTVKFIMGTEELTEESFDKFCETMKGLGTEDALKIKQKAYDRSVGKE